MLTQCLIVILYSMKFQTHYDTVKKPVEKTGKSMTVPDQALTPNEVFKRFASGLSVDAAMSSAYDGEDDTSLDDDWKFKDFSRMDMAELEEFRHEVMARQRELQNTYQQRKREYDTHVAEQRKKAWEADFEKMEKRMRERAEEIFGKKE